MNLQKLVVHHYSEDLSEERRVTISPGQVVALAAEVEDIVIKGRSLRKVSVLFLDQASLDLVVNHADLSTLEEAIGAYAFE